MRLSFIPGVVIAVIAIGAFAIFGIVSIIYNAEPSVAAYYIIHDDVVYGCNGTEQNLDNCYLRSNARSDEDYDSKLIEGTCDQQVMVIGFPATPIFYTTCVAT